MSIDVWIAPGHGRRPNGTMDPGATANGKTEQSEGDIIVGHAVALLKKAGLDVYRQPRGGPNFPGSITDINNRKPKIAVEVHHDWSGAPRGGFGFQFNKEHEKLNAAIHEEYKKAGLPTRNHMRNLPGTTTPPAIMSRTQPVTVLWEVDRIGSVQNHRAYGEAIAKGILKYLGADVSPPSKPVTPPKVENPPVVVDNDGKETVVVDNLVRLRVNEAVRLGEAAAAGSVAQIRHDVGMPPDTHSDIIHAKRIRAGEHGGKSYDITTVFERLTEAGKAFTKGADQAACRKIEGTG